MSLNLHTNSTIGDLASRGLIWLADKTRAGGALTTGSLVTGAASEQPAAGNMATRQGVSFSSFFRDDFLSGLLQSGFLHDFFSPVSSPLLFSAPSSALSPSLSPSISPSISRFSSLGSSLAAPFPLLLSSACAFRAWHLALQSSLPLPYLFWIGRNTWPTPFTLEQIALNLNADITPDILFRRCIFVDPPNRKASLWAIETALKTKGVGAVIAQPGKVSLTTSRRFSLAARNSGALGILLHQAPAPNTEASAGRALPSRLPTSAARTRWWVTPTTSETLASSWRLELLKVKGSHSSHSLWQLLAYDGELTLRPEIAAPSLSELTNNTFSAFRSHGAL